MNDITLTLVGNVVNEVKLRFTKNGDPVASFRVAAGTRRYDRSAERWIDGDTHFFDVSCWRTLSHNVIQTLEKGMPVVIVGRLRSREVHKECGDHVHPITYHDIDAVTVGPDLSRGIATFTRVKREAVIAAEKGATDYALEQARRQGLIDPEVPMDERDLETLPDEDRELVDPETGEILDSSAA
jgi:single-strand DNA-binding protein